MDVVTLLIALATAMLSLIFLTILNHKNTPEKTRHLAIHNDEKSELPDEVILKIFKNLSVRENIQCSMVNHQFYRISRDEELWRSFLSRDFGLEDYSCLYLQQYVHKFKKMSELKTLCRERLRHGFDVLWKTRHLYIFALLPLQFSIFSVIVLHFRFTIPKIPFSWEIFEDMEGDDFFTALLFVGLLLVVLLHMLALILPITTSLCGHFVEPVFVFVAKFFARTVAHKTFLDDHPSICVVLGGIILSLWLAMTIATIVSTAVLYYTISAFRDRGDKIKRCMHTPLSTAE